ncbi:MAG: hypothetical protein AAFV53_25890 [Myxococcota bacterium]
MTNQRLREHALMCRPPPIREENLNSYVWVRSQSGIDETCITFFDVRPVADQGCSLSRQVWWFEEEAMSWVLDENDEWFLPVADARRLIAALQAATGGP